MFEEFARNGTPPRTPDPECAGMALAVFRNSLGTPRETQGVLRGNLTPKTKILYSADQVVFRSPMQSGQTASVAQAHPSQSGEGSRGR